MTKIKIVGALIFIISIVLFVLFTQINNQNNANNNLLKIINQQKAFTQEISKNIFYISKNKDSSTKQLNDSIRNFLINMENRDDNLKKISSNEIKEQGSKIVVLWNQFYILVQNFKDQHRVTTAYSKILIEKTVIDIYNTNLKLVLEFDKLLKISKEQTSEELNLFKNIFYALFSILVLLLLYLFTQLRSLLAFIQKFIYTSKNIITSSSIKELQPIEHLSSTKDISQATSNFNQLVENINESIQHSSSSLEHSSKSLENLEGKIENLMEFINTMEETNSIDDNLTQKEDALIQSLEEIAISTQNLQNLKEDLDKLISHYKN